MLRENSASADFLWRVFIFLSNAAFLSAGLILRYRNAVCLMRFMLESDLQCSPVRLHRCHFASSDSNFFELRLLVYIVL